MPPKVENRSRDDDVDDRNEDEPEVDLSVEFPKPEIDIQCKPEKCVRDFHC